ncbi:MAG: NAD-dependent epimerase/dehydratase family protein [Gemmatimonadota bacterium]
MTVDGREPRSVLVAGCGYVGSALAMMLVADGDRVWGLRRDPAGLPDGVRPVRGDVTQPRRLDGVPPHLDAVVYAVAPAGRTEEAYRAAYVDGLVNVLRAAGDDHTPFRGRLVLVSSTGVYGESEGAWVDEDTPPEPVDATGRVLVEAERIARTFGGRGVTLRLGGIYGPGRDRTVRRVLSGEAGCPEPDRFGNRIHRDDAAAAARHLISLQDPHPVYVGVDRDPADLRTVYRWIAERAGIADPCADNRDDGTLPTRRRGTNKRCSSERLVRSGYTFRYPTFREGYAEFIR